MEPIVIISELRTPMVKTGGSLKPCRPTHLAANLSEKSFCGGLMRYTDAIGIEQIVTRLKQLQKTYGDRFSPCDLLVTMADNKESFYRGTP